MFRLILIGSVIAAYVIAVGCAIFLMFRVPEEGLFTDPAGFTMLLAIAYLSIVFTALIFIPTNIIASIGSKDISTDGSETSSDGRIRGRYYDEGTEGFPPYLDPHGDPKGGFYDPFGRNRIVR